MHFELTLSNNGQYLDPINSGPFFVTNASGTSIFTSGSIISTSSLAPTSSAHTTTKSTTSAQSSSAGSLLSTHISSSPISQSGISRKRLAMGIGLGIGIPLVLVIVGIIAYILRKRMLSKKKWLKGSEKEHNVQIPGSSFENRLEFPKHAFHEMNGSDTRHELSSEPNIYEAPGQDLGD